MKLKRSAPFKPASSAARTFPHIAPGWVSGNWSGYAIRRSKRHSFHSISGYWVVPRIKPSRRNKYSSAWLGIDGFGNSRLIQTGTEQDYKHGKAVYYAWWEVLPAAETKIPHPVSPGDLMFAKIARLRKNKWLILLKNITRGWIFKKVRTYTGPAVSAEWIMEAPTINGTVSRLANYRKTIFFKCRVNRHNPWFKRKNRGVMVQNGRAVSVPSLPNFSRDSFIVAHGSILPR